MSENERHEFENTLARHTAPALLGVKCANLISVEQSEETVTDYLTGNAEEAERCGLRFRIMCKCRERTLIYVYHEKLLRAWLEDSEAADFLSEYGYHREMKLDEKLSLLASRMSCGCFPHEAGVFLGYPIEDIRGFIRNQGRNYLLCGYWKVYSDIGSAQRTFNIYGRCREILCDRLKQGLTLFQALEISREEI